MLLLNIDLYFSLLIYKEGENERCSSISLYVSTHSLLGQCTIAFFTTIFFVYCQVEYRWQYSCKKSETFGSKDSCVLLKQKIVPLVYQTLIQILFFDNYCPQEDLNLFGKASSWRNPTTYMINVHPAYETSSQNSGNLQSPVTSFRWSRPIFFWFLSNYLSQSLRTLNV
jgi:hypothetical protein